MTSAAFASLAAPVFEDSMELTSSPAGNQLDDDIDIDIDYYDNSANLPDDEYMVDDGEPIRPATATDDMMDDDDQTLVAPINEEEMHDGPDVFTQAAVDDHEDELIDYDDEDLKNQAPPGVNDTAHNVEAGALAASVVAQAAEEPVDEEIVRNPQEVVVELTSSTETEQVDEVQQVELKEHIEAEPSADPSELKSATATQEQESTEAVEGVIKETLAESSREDPSLSDGTADDLAEALLTQEAEEDALREQATSLQPLPGLSGALDTDVGPVLDGPSTPTDTGLHPMTIKFGDHEMPLFKSRAQPAGLLKDDNLVSVSLADLIHGCRKRLSLKLGDGHVPEDQDLVLNFDHLGMMLFEGSRSASATSLNDVVDVYLALYRNDGTEEAPPLVLSLQPQPFSAMFEGLKRAAEEGTGMSHFAPTSEESGHSDHQEHEHSPAEEEGDDAAQTSNMNDDGNDEAEENYGFDFDNGEDENQEQPLNYVEQEEQTHGEDQYQEEDYQHEETADFEHQEYPGPEDDLDQYEDDGAYEHGLDAGEAKEEQPAYGNIPQEVVHPASTASSDTVRGDSLNGGTGEYDLEDGLIEFDDESDLTNTVDATADNGQDDFSAFLAAGDNEHTQDASVDVRETEQDEYQDKADPAAGKDAENAAETIGDQTAPQDSEDFLDESYLATAEDVTDLTADLENYYDDKAGEDLLDFAAEETGPQTDSLEQRPEDFDSSEDTEQFHTAVDLLDGADEPKNETTAEAPSKTANDEPYDDQDDLRFDDDDDDEEAVKTAAAPDTPAPPLGKRSFDEHADEDEVDVAEPDLKKARSSG